MIANFLKATFEEVYGPGFNPTNFTGQIYKFPGFYPNHSNCLYVHNSVFNDFSSPSYGGVFNCDKLIIKLLIEHTSFIECKTLSRYGGAIYLKSTTDGQCVLSKICGFNCTTKNSGTTYGQFAYIEVKSDVNYKNHVNDSTITRTLKESKSPQDVLSLSDGTILCPSVNLTNNQFYRYGVLSCTPTKGVQNPVEDTCCITYSSIVNNTAIGGYGCIWLDLYTSSHFIGTCNILNNQQDATNYGTIYAKANLLINESCILGNNQGNKVFYENHGTCKIKLSNCTIDDDIFVIDRFYGIVIVIYSLERTFINPLSHIVTQSCDSYFDSYGSLTGLPNVPGKGPKTSRCLLSCICRHPMINPLRTMTFILLFTLLPSELANYNSFKTNLMSRHVYW